MEISSKDQTSVRDYLLGKLSEDEQEKFEERLMLEDELFQELEVSKGELIEEYRAADLPQNESRWLEQHFLSSSEGTQRYAMAFALQRLGHPAPKPWPGFYLFGQLKNFVGNRPWVIATATAAVTALIVAAVLLSPGTNQSVVGPTLVSSVLNREEGRRPQKFTIPAHATEVRFRLLLSRDIAPSRSFRAELDNKTQVLPVKVIEHDREGVWVAVPVTQLPRGEYSLKLFAITSEGTEREIPGNYLINIE